jgi:hypothetical protein
MDFAPVGRCLSAPLEEIDVISDIIGQLSLVKPIPCVSCSLERTSPGHLVFECFGQ